MPFELNVLDDAPRGFEARDDSFAGPPACACPLCGNLAYNGPGDGPVAFQPPTEGTAGNGLPIFDWDQVAAQLTRNGVSWTFALGAPVEVTYAFRIDPPGTMPSGTSLFSQFNAEQIAFTEMILSLWADVANITFTRVTEEGSEYSNNASMLFGNYGAGADGASAFAYYPWPTATSPTDWEGDVWINISLANNSALTWGGFGAQTISHEIGHALGLAHPADYDALSGEPVTYPESSAYWQDSRAYTVMSYFGSGGVGHSLNAFAFGPQLHDIAAIQLLYGANMTTRTGDTVYGFNSNTGLLHYSLTTGADSPVFSIWDAGGNDTLDFSGYVSNVEIDLREEAFSSAGPGNGGVGVAIGNISIARGAVIENGIGGAGADLITGNAVANVLSGRNGGDVINAGAGADTIYGDDGDDQLHGEGGADLIDGGNGNDTLNGDDGDDILYGRADSDILNGGTGADQMYGGGGNDVYQVDNAGDIVAEGAGSGQDTVISSVNYALSAYVEELTLIGSATTGSGNAVGNTIIGNDLANTLSGLAGADALIGAGGADTMYGGNGDDNLSGGLGDDILDGGGDSDTFQGEAGADTLYGRSGNDGLYAGDDNDLVFGGDGDDVSQGGGGADQLDGGNGNDSLYGQAGDDVIYGRQNNDVLVGGDGVDQIYGGDGADSADGTEGNDLVDGGNGDDVLGGGADNDVVYGRQNNDTLFGDAGDDFLYGGDGNDNLSGGDGVDYLDAGNGADRLNGGLGNDTLIGWTGVDTFVFSTTLGAGNVDIISGFNVLDDTIELSTAVFTGIGIGVLGSNAFVIGAAAGDADDRIIYDSATGALYYDADGNGGGAAVQFATLAPSLALTANDFLGGP